MKMLFFLLMMMGNMEKNSPQETSEVLKAVGAQTQEQQATEHDIQVLERKLKQQEESNLQASLGEQISREEEQTSRLLVEILSDMKEQYNKK